jgi:hypothetical protein
MQYSEQLITLRALLHSLSNLLVEMGVEATLAKSVTAKTAAAFVEKYPD